MSESLRRAQPGKAVFKARTFRGTAGPQRCGTNGKPTMRGAGEVKEREEKGRDACRGLLRRRSSEELSSEVKHGTGESDKKVHRSSNFLIIYYGEFDSGSERTLAAWIRHASRTE